MSDEEIVYGGRIGAKVVYGRTAGGDTIPLMVDDGGKVMIAEMTANIDPTGLATSAKQDTQITAEQAIQAMLEATRTISSAAVSASSKGDNTLIVAPGAGKQLWIMKLFLAAARGSEVNMILKSGSTAKTGTMQIDSIAADLDFTPIKCGTNEAFVLNLSDAVAVSGIVLYRTVDV